MSRYFTKEQWRCRFCKEFGKYRQISGCFGEITDIMLLLSVCELWRWRNVRLRIMSVAMLWWYWSCHDVFALVMLPLPWCHRFKPCHDSGNDKAVSTHGEKAIKTTGGKILSVRRWKCQREMSLKLPKPYRKPFVSWAVSRSQDENCSKSVPNPSCQHGNLGEICLVTKSVTRIFDGNSLVIPSPHIWVSDSPWWIAVGIAIGCRLWVLMTVCFQMLPFVCCLVCW